MTATVFGNPLPLTEDEFLALGETQQRVELIDGSLLLSGRGAPRHQYVVQALATVLRAGDGHVLAAVNVRLRPGRILIPDLIVAADIDFDSPLVEATSVRLVAEIFSPASPAIAEVLRMHCYAAAGIRWYLLLDQETAALRGYELVGERYLERSPAIMQQALNLGTRIVGAGLLPPD